MTSAITNLHLFLNLHDEPPPPLPEKGVPPCPASHDIFENSPAFKAVFNRATLAATPNLHIKAGVVVVWFLAYVANSMHIIDSLACAFHRV